MAQQHYMSWGDDQYVQAAAQAMAPCPAPPPPPQRILRTKGPSRFIYTTSFPALEYAPGSEDETRLRRELERIYADFPCDTLREHAAEEDDEVDEPYESSSNLLDRVLGRRNGGLGGRTRRGRFKSVGRVR